MCDAIVCGAGKTVLDPDWHMSVKPEFLEKTVELAHLNRKYEDDNEDRGFGMSEQEFFESSEMIRRIIETPTNKFVRAKKTGQFSMVGLPYFLEQTTFVAKFWQRDYMKREYPSIVPVNVNLFASKDVKFVPHIDGEPYLAISMNPSLLEPTFDELRQQDDDLTKNEIAEVVVITPREMRAMLPAPAKNEIAMPMDQFAALIHHEAERYQIQASDFIPICIASHKVLENNVHFILLFSNRIMEFREKIFKKYCAKNKKCKLLFDPKRYSAVVKIGYKGSDEILKEYVLKTARTCSFGMQFVDDL